MKKMDIYKVVIQTLLCVLLLACMFTYTNYKQGYADGYYIGMLDKKVGMSIDDRMDKLSCKLNNQNW